MKKKPICLITGSSGLVGSEAVIFFSKKNFEIIGIDNNFRKFFFGKSASTNQVKKKLSKIDNFSHFNVDIRSSKKLSNIFKKYKNRIKLIIHCAAQPSHDWAYNNPMLDFEINANLLLIFWNWLKVIVPNLFLYFFQQTKYTETIQTISPL